MIKNAEELLESISKLENTTFFDFQGIRPSKGLPTQNILYSEQLYNIIKNTEEFGAMGSVTRNEARLNASTLTWLVLDVYRTITANSPMASNYNTGSYVPKTLVGALFKNANFEANLDITNKSLELIDEYAVPFNQVFFINTATSDYPLRVYRTKNFSIFYKLSSMSSLLNMLNKLVKLLISHVTNVSVFLLSDRASLLFKQYIIQLYTGINLSDYMSSNNYNYIIADAYNNLISMSLSDLDNEINLPELIVQAAMDFRNNLVRGFSIGYYPKFYLKHQLQYYNSFFDVLNNGADRLIQFLNLPKKHDPAKGTPLDIKYYYMYNDDGSERDQDFRACNKTKMDPAFIRNEVLKFFKFNSKLSGLIDLVHPDIVLGLYNISLHLKLLSLDDKLYCPNSSLAKFINKLLNAKIRTKPILVKFLIKNGADVYFHISKTKGMIEFNQFEVLFGFRNAGLILDEIHDDYMNWFTQDLDKNGPIQGQFIDKHASDYFRKFLGATGKPLIDTINGNLNKFSDFESLVGNPSSFLSSTGAVDRDLFQADTVDGKSHGISKNIYFSLFRDPNEYIKDGVNHKTNKVIIKYEEYVKQRIVINTTLGTFGPLAQLNEFVKKTTNGGGNIYFSSSRKQKALLNKRLQRYLQYNRYVDKKYVILPLDYSSYDHTITVQFIINSLRQLADQTKYASKVRALVNQFLFHLKDEDILFTKLKGTKFSADARQKYKYGMLSGWKITSSVESLGNAIISYGVCAELGLKLVDLLTMGDDLVLVIDKPHMNQEQLHEFLVTICDKYESLGFKMNAPKNSISYNFCEFLRVVYYPNQTINYPARILPSISVLKPGREEATFGAREYLTVSKKICKRYGALSLYPLFVKQTSRGYKLHDIRRNAYQYVLKPYNFEFKRREREDYIIKCDISHAPIFKRYVGYLGLEYSDTINKYIYKNIARHVTTLTTLRAKKHEISHFVVPKRNIKIISDLVSQFKREVSNNDTLRFKIRIPEYHLTKLLIDISTKMALSQAKLYLTRVVGELRSQNAISPYEASDSFRAISNLGSKADIIRALTPDKMLVEDEYAQNILVSYIKDQFIKWAESKLSTNIRGEYALILKKIINKDDSFYSKRVLGMLISDLGEIKLSGYPLLVGLRVD